MEKYFKTNPKVKRFNEIEFDENQAFILKANTYHSYAKYRSNITR